jgi:hypothetical protein
MIPELEGIEILDSWFESKDELDVQITKARKSLNALLAKRRRLEKERKLQPPIHVQGGLSGDFYIAKQYQIINLEKGLFLAEWKVEADYSTTPRGEIPLGEPATSEGQQ